MSFLRLPTIGQSSKKKRIYDTDLIAKAYKDVVKSGISVYKAARLYGIPESTLRDRTLGIQPITEEDGTLPSYGQPPTFSASEERELVEHIRYMAEIGYGYTRAEFMNLATDWAVTLGRKKQSDPVFASSWYTGFKKRNPEVTLAKPQKLSMLRAKCSSEETFDKYFSELSKVFKKYDFESHPEFIWNVDETGLMMEHNPRHVVCAKGVTPQAITSNRGKTVTILACGSASGSRLPPYYVFPGIRWNQDLLTGACPGSRGTVTESGWSNSVVFMEWLETHFTKHVATKDHPVLILFDGHKSHVNLTLSEWGKANNVIFFVLPPHTSHITQPLDVGCFGPLKNVYYSECQAYMRRNPGMQVNRYNIAEISSKAYNKGVCADNLIAAFRKSGVFPLQRKSISSAKTAPSTIYIDHTGDKEQPCDAPANHELSFLESKKINKALDTSSRKRRQTIMGDLSSPSKKVMMTPTEKNIKNSSSKSSKKLCTSTIEPVPGPSGDKTVTSQTTDNDSIETEVSEEDLCCVCGKYTPDSLNLIFTLEFVKWAQCDKCNHWTHLKFCSGVRCLRRGDGFLCPHCQA